jgi:electron transfer flavoprotein beta subunit
MKICVLVKQVPDHEAIVTARTDGTLDVEDRYVTSFFDEIAIEQALRLREAHGGTVTALAAGGGKQTDALRRALAMGADEAVAVDDPALATADGLGTARALAALLATLEPDLVLAGRVALDDEMGLVGPAVAEFLDLPHVSDVIAMQTDSKIFSVTRLVEGATHVVEGAFPALMTVTKGLAEPRVPKVMAVMKASRARIDARDLASLGVDASTIRARSRIVSYRPPATRAPVKMIEGDVDAQVASLAEILVASAGGDR